MKSVFSRRINKTPLLNTSTITKRIKHTSPQLLDHLLSSPYAGEGVFGFEYLLNNHFEDLFYFTPPILDIQTGEKVSPSLLWVKENTSIYTALTDKSLCFPLQIKQSEALFHKISSIKKELKDEDILIQTLLCKRIDDWRELAITQYSDYLNGIDVPAVNPMMRKIQNNVTKLIDNLTMFHVKHSNVDEIERKIKENGYRFEMRVVIAAENKKVRKQIKQCIDEVLKGFDFFNSLRLHEVKGNEVVQNVLLRKFSGDSTHQILCESEINSLLLSDKPVALKPAIPKKEVKEVSKEKLSPLPNQFDILPVGEKKERKVDPALDGHIKTSLKRVGIIESEDGIELRNTYQGFTLQRFTYTIPDGVNISKFQKHLKDIRAAIGIETLTIQQGSEPNTVAFIIPCEEREVLWLREVIEDKKFLEFAENAALPLIVGVDELGNLIFVDLAKLVHLLVAGTTGSGKSVWLNSSILTLLLMRNPTEMIMYLVDPKQVELPFYRGFNHVKDVITDMKKANALFNSLVVQMDKRYTKFAEYGVRDISSYNKNNPNDKIPYIVCVVDEYADLKKVYPHVEGYIERLGAKARAAGIHIILATQRPHGNVVSTQLKSVLPSAISFRLKTSSDYQTVFGKGIPYSLLGEGDGAAMIEGQVEEFRRFQSAIISPDENEGLDVIEKCKEIHAHINVEGIEINEETVEEPIDKLKKIIATTEETRVSELRKLMGVKMDTIRELIEELVEEGWLLKHKAKNKGYELVASEEELAEWKEEEE